MSDNLNYKTFKIKVCHDQRDIYTNMCTKLKCGLIYRTYATSNNTFQFLWCTVKS